MHKKCLSMHQPIADKFKLPQFHPTQLIIQLFPFGDKLGYFLIEFFGMILVFNVNEFMNNDIINQSKGQFHSIKIDNHFIGFRKIKNSERTL